MTYINFRDDNPILKLSKSCQSSHYHLPRKKKPLPCHLGKLLVLEVDLALLVLDLYFFTSSSAALSPRSPLPRLGNKRIEHEGGRSSEYGGRLSTRSRIWPPCRGSSLLRFGLHGFSSFRFVLLILPLLFSTVLVPLELRRRWAATSRRGVSPLSPRRGVPPLSFSLAFLPALAGGLPLLLLSLLLRRRSPVVGMARERAGPMPRLRFTVWQHRRCIWRSGAGAGRCRTG